MRESNLDKKLGCLLGGAIGDALGMPYEGFSEKMDISLSYKKAPKNHPNASLVEGQFTDDTLQTIILAQSLIDSKGFNLLNFSEKLKLWYAGNKDDSQKMRWIGRSSRKALTKLFNGVSPFQSGSIDTLSNGSIMRVAPVALFYDDIDLIKQIARESSCVTHNSVMAKEACSFFAATIYYLIEGLEPVAAIRTAKEEITDSQLLNRINAAIKLSLEQREPGKISADSTNIMDTLPIALYSFLRSPKSFESVMRNSLQYSKSDTDTTLSLAGQLAGAYLGVDNIPKYLRDGLEKSEQLDYVLNNIVNGATKLYVVFDLETIAAKHPEIPRKETIGTHLYVGQYLGYLAKKAMQLMELKKSVHYLNRRTNEEVIGFYIDKHTSAYITSVHKDIIPKSRFYISLCLNQKKQYNELVLLRKSIEEIN